MLFPEGAQNMSLLNRNAVLKCIVVPFVPFDNKRPLSDVASGGPKQQRDLPLRLWLKMFNEVMKRPSRTYAQEIAVRHAINDINVQYFSLLGASNV